MSEVGAGVITEAFGSRFFSSNVTPKIEAAQSLANTVIDTVDGVLDTLRGEGDDSLQSAVEAIRSLGAFRPTKVSIDYKAPEYKNTTNFLVPSPFNAGQSGDGRPDASPVPKFDWTIDIQNPPSPGGTPPVPSNISLPTPPVPLPPPAEPQQPNSVFVPPDGAPGLGSVSSMQTITTAPPALIAFTAPTLTSITLPTLAMDLTSTLPGVPGITVSGPTATAYTPTFAVLEEPVLLVDGAELIGPKVTPREIRESVQVLTSRGVPVPQEVIEAQTAYASERAQLLNAAERRRLSIDTTLRQTEVARAVMVFVQQLDGMVAEASLGLAKLAFEVEVLKASAQIDLVQAAVNLYNGRVMAFNVAVALYKSRLDAKGIELEKWKAQLAAEIAKTQINEQQGKVYETSIRALTTQATVYNAQVDALMASIEGYKAQTQAAALTADVTRTNLATFGGKVDAYIARLSAHKAKFDRYSAEARGTVAKNQSEATKAQISSANISAATAGMQASAARMEAQAESLKAQAANKGATSSNANLTNSIEAVMAQIDADIGRNKIMEWSAQQQITRVKADGIIDNARMAQQYYAAASEGAYRASEQALRAVLASTQASAMAQEAASKTAASVAQGAYSAVHVSASLTGSGRVSGDEDSTARDSIFFSDMLNSNESAETILNA